MRYYWKGTYGNCHVDQIGSKFYYKYCRDVSKHPDTVPSDSRHYYCD